MSDAIQLLTTKAPKTDQPIQLAEEMAEETPKFAEVFAADVEVESAPKQAAVAVTPTETEGEETPNLTSDESVEDGPDLVMAATSKKPDIGEKRAQKPLDVREGPPSKIPSSAKENVTENNAKLAPVKADDNQPKDTKPAPNQMSEKASMTQAALVKSREMPRDPLGPIPARMQLGDVPKTTIQSDSNQQTQSKMDIAPKGAATPNIAPEASISPRKLRMRSEPEPQEVARQTPTPMSPDKPQAAIIAGPTTPTVHLFDKTITSQDAQLEEVAIQSTRGHAGSEVTHAARSSIAQTPQAQAEVARHVGGQLAVAVTQNRAGVTEVALNPQELGKVRMTMTAQDNAMILSIVAERPETQDLMRRHIDHLNQEFRNLGYQDVKFSFGDGTAAHQQDKKENVQEFGAGDDPANQVETTGVTRQITPDAGLDLRL